MKVTTIKNRLAVLGIAAIFLAGAAHADRFVNYTFSNPSAIAAPSGVSPDLTANDVGIGQGMTGYKHSKLGSATSGSIIFDNREGSRVSEQEAVSKGNYVELSVVVRPGIQVSFTDLTFQTLRRGLNNEGAGTPDRFSLYTSRDNYAAPIGSGTLPLQSGDSTAFTLQTVAMSDVPALQSVPGGPVGFRIYFWNSQEGEGPAKGMFRLDDLILNGTVSRVAAPRGAPEDWYSDTYIHSHISLALPLVDMDFIEKQIEMTGIDAIQIHTHSLDLWDAFRERKLAEKLNFKMVATINQSGTWYSRYDEDEKYVYRIHADGSFAGRWTRKHLCFNAPVVRDEVIPVKYRAQSARLKPDQVWVDECIITVNVCYCDHCRALYLEEYNAQPPEKLTADNRAEWEQWVKFHRDSFDRWMIDVRAAVHEHNPDTLVTFNHAYFLEQPEAPPPFITNLSGDVHKEHLELGVYARYGGSGDLPFDLLPGLGADTWAGNVPKTIDTVYTDIALIIAHSGRWNIGEYPNSFTKLRVEPRFHTKEYRRADLYLELAEKGARFARERRPFSKDTRSVPHAALLHSARTHYAHVIDNMSTVNEEGGFGMTSDGHLSRNDTGKINSRVFWPNNKPVYHNVVGAYESLVENHVHFDLINEDQLQDRLGDYKLLVLSEQTYLEDETVEEIKKFVANGGNVVATGSSLNTGLEELFGLKRVVEGGLSNVGMEIDGDKVAFENAWSVEVVDAETLAVFDGTENPMVTVNRHGKGQCIYIAADIFQKYFDRSGYSYKPKGNSGTLQNYMDSIYSDLLSTEGLQLQADPWYEITVRKNEQQEVLVHIINRSMDWKPYPRTSSEIKIAVPMDSEPDSVLLQPGNEELDFEYEKGRLELSLDPAKVKYHRIIQVK